MNARRVNAASGVIHAAQKTKQTSAGIALALESAGLLQSPESAAELVSLRARVTELETSTAPRLCICGHSRHAHTVPAPHSCFAFGQTCPCPTYRQLLPDEAREQLQKNIAAGEARAAEQAARLEDPHDSPLHHTYAVLRDLPEVTRWSGATELAPDREIRTLAASGLVGYRQNQGRLLHCLAHKPAPASRYADFHEVTADDLDDGGVCVHPRCGRDLLASWPAPESGGAS